MIDEALPHERHRLEAPMGVLRESGDDTSVIHAPAICTREIHADVTDGQGRCRTHIVIGRRIAVHVMNAEQERVRRLPRHTEGTRLDHGVIHTGKFIDLRRPAFRTDPPTPLP
jgi:chloramphenicol 3-O-phosphotransferase